MEAANTSSGVDLDNDGEPDMTAAAFYEVGGVVYHRNEETGRVFRLMVNIDRLARSLASDADDEQGAAADVEGVARFQEVGPSILEGARPLREDQLDALVADDLFLLADEIDEHVEGNPLPDLNQ
jgi:hypothetical protein